MTQTENLVENLVNKFQKNGLDVLYAKCDGYPEPVEVQGAVPDVVAWDSFKELYHLGVVADSQSIHTDETKEKMSVLSKMMMSKGASEGKLLPLYLGVKQDSSEIADQRIQDTNLTSQNNIQKIII